MSLPTDPHARPPLDGGQLLPINLCAPSPHNPGRLGKRMTGAALAELADSIDQVGVLQPIVVRPRDGAKAGEPLYEIVCGERRWRAARIVMERHPKRTEIPTVVRHLDDFQALELANIENLQRHDLHPLEEAEGYERLLKKNNPLRGYTLDELAARLGKSRSYLTGRLKLCDLAPVARTAFYEEKISASVALLIARQPADQQPQIVKDVTFGRGGDAFSHRDAFDWIHRNYMRELGRAVFPIADASLVPAAGSCTDCPKRTGANPDLFNDVKKADTCTDGTCFASKEEAHQARKRAEAEAQGVRIIDGREARKVKPHEYSDRLEGYLRLDQTDYAISDKPIAKLLGKDSPVEVVLLEDPHTKQLIKVVDKKAALEVLKAKGVVKSTREPTGNAQQREAEAKAKRETLYRREVARTALEQLGEQLASATTMPAWLIPIAAAAMYSRLDHEACKRVHRLLAIEGDRIGSSFGERAQVDAHFQSLSGSQLAAHLVAMSIAGDLHIGTYVSKYSTDDRLHQVATLTGVDAKAIKAQLAAEERDRARSTKAKASPSVAKPKPAKGSLPLQPAAPRGKKPEGANAPKYRNAATGETWSGRGLQPAWLKAAIAGGKTLSDFDTAAQAGKAADEVKDEAPAAPARRPVVGERWRVKPDAKGRGKTAGREGTVHSVSPSSEQVTLSWGPRSHERGVYDFGQVEPLEVTDETAAAPPRSTAPIVLSAAAADPFRGAEA
jgi:ParB/RepB/Spo0J family partition protein